MNFNDDRTLDFIDRSLKEDIGDGDHSSLASIPLGTQGAAQLLFKEEGIVAGIDLAVAIFKRVDASLTIERLVSDGDKVKSGDQGLTVRGPVHSILKSERLVLNCLQRLSGIATTTRKIVDLIKDTGTRILDTRKTTPGLRFLEKWAVTVGGGYNHREGLYDMIMLKDNHIDYAGGITAAMERTNQYLAAHDLPLKIEIETRSIEEVKEALRCENVFRIMLDNFTPDMLRTALELINGVCETEASGGITQNNVLDYAATGVDFISIGALTHSIKSLDMSLKEI